MSQIIVAQLVLALVAAHASAEPIYPVCPPNSEPKQCGSLCEPTCTEPANIPCDPENPESCKAECRCLDGWVRNEDTNECVKPSECPISTTATAIEQSTPSVPNCSRNETLTPCGILCEPTCAIKTPNKLFCPRIPCIKFLEGCRCSEGYYRNTDSDKCVLSDDCPVINNKDIPQLEWIRWIGRYFAQKVISENNLR